MKEKQCNVCGTKENLYVVTNQLGKFFSNVCNDCYHKKLSDARRGRPSSMLGKKHSPETIAKMRIVHSGTIMPEKTRLALRNANLGNQYGVGHKVTPEHIEIIKKTHKGKKLYPHQIEFLKKPRPEEWCRNVSLNHRKYQTKEARENISKTLQERKPNLGSHRSEESKALMKEKALLRVQRDKYYVSKIEFKVKDVLDKLGIKYIHQHYIKDIEHKYVADFYLPDKNIIIECDGNYWHRKLKQFNMDIIRNKELADKGFKVFRFWESEINKHIDFIEFVLNKEAT